MRNIRVALRSLLRVPVYTGCVLLALAIGIGANTVIFSIVNAVLLHPLPYSDPERLFLVTERQPRGAGDKTPVSAPDYLDWKSQNDAFMDLLAFRPGLFTLSGVKEPEELDANQVTVNAFNMLGVHAWLGRTFLREEGERGGERVAIISHSLWKRKFASNPSIVGTSIRLNDAAYSVIGVMPKGFDFPPAVTLGRNTVAGNSDIWLPLTFTDQELQNRQFRFLRVIGRLKPDVSSHQATSRMQTLAQRLAMEYPSTNAGWGVHVIPLRENVVGDVRVPLLAMLAAVGFVLLITCSNIAHLALARATSRQKEITIRLAIGASRSNIVLQLLTEHMLLGLTGGVLGIALTCAGVAALPNVLPPGLLIPNVEQVRIDFTVLAFALLTGAISAVLFGFAPIWHSFTLSLNEVLRSSERSFGGSRRGHWTRAVLVSSEVALTVVLLTGASLMLKSFLRLMATDLGFRQDNVLAVPVAMPQSRYPDGGRMMTFCTNLEGEARSLPGVRAAGVITILPATGQNVVLRFTKHGELRAAGNELTAGFRFATPSYFQVMRIPLVQGRLLAETDTADRPTVVLIDQVAAQHYWPRQNPIGGQINIMGEINATVVGVLGSVRSSIPETESIPTVYLPLAQAPADVLPAVGRRMTFVLQTSGDPTAIAAAVRQTILRTDPGQAVSKVMTMQTVVSNAEARPRFLMALSTTFAAIALLLATIGIYGIVSYTTSRRSAEIGLRMALGASPGNIIWMILRQGTAQLLIGLGIGILLAVVATRSLKQMLFGVEPLDFSVYALVVFLVFMVAVGAIAIPATRAARANPNSMLRHE